MTLEEFELAMNRIEDDMAWDYCEHGRIGGMWFKFNRISWYAWKSFTEIMSPTASIGFWLGVSSSGFGSRYPNKEANANRLNAFYFFEQICLEYELYKKW